MKRLSVIAAGLLVVAFTVFGCASMDSGWVTLIDGEKGLDNWNRIGGANWRAEGGAIVADKSTTKGSSFLITKESYKDFEIRAEFWAESHTNSGIFIRCTDVKNVTSTTGYEVNIWDTRPDPSYGTGAIVGVASVPVPIIYKAGGRWSTMEIYAKGPEMTIKFNGVVSAHARDGRFPQGPFALQFSEGPIKWRMLQVRPL